MLAIHDIIAVFSLGDLSSGLVAFSASVKSAFSLLGARVNPSIQMGKRDQNRLTPSMSDTRSMLSRAIHRSSLQNVSISAASLPQRLSLDEQFARTVAVVETARAHSKSAAILQKSALQKLDVAEYALHQLMAELRTVMPQPAKLAYANAPPLRQQEIERATPMAIAA